MTHPYFPTTLELPLYVTPTQSLNYILSTFLLYILMITIPTFIITSSNPRLTLKPRLLILWYLINFFVHFVFEGYYIFYFNGNIESKNDIFAELWKEYSKADSRYLSKDFNLWLLEVLTVVSLILYFGF